MGSWKPRLGGVWRRITGRGEAGPGAAGAAAGPDREIAALLLEAKRHLQEGRPDQAAAQLRAAVALDSADRDLRRRLARLESAAGDAAAAERAWRDLLALDPANAEAHAVLAKLCAGRPADAAPHLEFLALADPGDPQAWKRLAAVRAALGDPAGEREALLRLLRAAPTDALACGRLAAIAMAEGDLASAAQLLWTQAQAWPDQPDHWAALADCLGRGHPAAGDAWRRVLAGSPLHSEARCQLDELDRYGPAGEIAPPSPAVLRGVKPRVIVVGNCQAYGLGRRLRELCPSAEVRTVGLVEVRSPDDAEALAMRWGDPDVLITQIIEAPLYGELRSQRMQARARRTAYFPRINFRGFHPDLLRAGVELSGFPIKGFHSAIVMAAHALDIPEGRVPDLFNAYVYGRLGYFDEHARSERLHIEDARRCGLELEPMLAAWRALGVWAHVPNHPKAGVMSLLAEGLARDLGLGGGEADGEMSDDLEGFGVWPVYPEIAARLGVAGGLDFRLGPGQGAIGLDEFVSRSYRAYGGLEPSRMRQAVSGTVAALEAEGL